MEQLKGLRQMESTLSLVSDHVSVLSSRLEALVFRAQRIAHAMKDGRQEPDMMFGYDLQNFRRDVRTFGNEIGGLGTTLGSISRAAQYDEESVAHAQSVMRVCDRLQRALAALRDQSQLAHQHIRQAEHKMEAGTWARRSKRWSIRTRACTPSPTRSSSW